MKRKIVCIFILTLLIITGLSSIVVADDWPMFHHDLVNTGFSASKAPEENILIWRYEIEGSLFSSPSVADGKVYVGSDDSKIYCLDADDGGKIWDYSTWGPVDSTSAIVDGKVYFGSNGGRVFCLDANDGSEIWQYNTAFEVSSSPKVYDGKVYIGSENGNMYCLDADDGSQIWVIQTGVCVLGSPAIYNNKVYIGSWGHDEVFCLNAINGDIIWTFKGEAWLHTSPVIADGKVYIGSSIMYCLNADTGNEIWSYQNEEPGGGGIEKYSCPAVFDGKVYFGSNNNSLQVGTIYCLDAEDGGKIWEYPTLEGMGSAPAVVDGKLYVNVWTGELYCLDVNDGTKIWSGEGGIGSPAVANKRIYNGGFAVYCYGDDTGNQPPNTPTIDGPPSGNKEIEYWYNFNATDPNGNYVWYSIDWGDGWMDEWIGPRYSGMKLSLNHTWYSEGTYTIRVKVKDIFDEESDYATLEVTMPKNKATEYSILSYFFDKFIYSFPFMIKILNQILI